MNQDAKSAPARSLVLARFFCEWHRYRSAARTWSWLLALIVISAVALRYYLFTITPPSYKSEGLMIMNVKLSLPTGNVYSEEWNNFLGTQVALLQSSTVSNRAVDRLRMAKPALQPETVKLHVSVLPKTSVFALSAIGSSPAYVQAWLDGVMDEYIKAKKEMVQHTSQNTRSGLGEAITNLQQELATGREELLAYGSSNSEVFLQDQGNSAANRLSELTKQRDELQGELDLLKMLTLDENVDLREAMVQQSSSVRPIAKQGTEPAPASPVASGGVDLPSLRQNPENVNPEETQSSLVGSEGDYLKAKQHVAILEQQWKELSSDLRPEHPKMVELREEIDRQKNLLEIFRSQTQEQLASRRHALELQIQNLNKQVAQWTVSVLGISKKMADYNAIKERIQRTQSMYDGLLNNDRTVDVEKQINPDSVTILQPATTPVLVPRDLPRQLFLAGLLGLMLGGAMLVVMRRLDDRPHSLTEMQEFFSEPVLGQIPLVRVKNRKRGVPVLKENDDRHALAEAYRNLRSSVLFLASKERQPRTILVTSAIPEDGKSVTAANLAVMLARAGARVLLVDADLRRGRIHQHFELPLGPGLAEVLDEQRAWSSVVTQNSVPNLYIVPRGTAPRHPGELFVKWNKEKFLKEAGRNYDFVVLDSTPVMAADDVSNLVPYVDGVLMVVRADYTSVRVARAALDSLYQRHANVLGIVFNGVSSNAGDYYYYKYKDYYNPAHG